MGLNTLIFASSIALSNPTTWLQINLWENWGIKEERTCETVYEIKDGINFIIQTCYWTQPLYWEWSFPNEDCENINDAMRSCIMPEFIMHDY